MSQQPQADSNPYASPSHATGERTPFKPERPRFRILAVIVGWLVDVVSSSVAGVVLGIVLGIVLVSRGASQEQMQQLLLVGGLLIGTCGSVVGGYVAAWMAKHWELQHAMATGLLSLVSGITVMLLFSLSQPTWINTIAFVLTVPAAVFGGLLRWMVARRNRE